MKATYRKPTPEELMAMPRRERRRIGKLNGGLKIPGTNKPIIKKK